MIVRTHPRTFATTRNYDCTLPIIHSLTRIHYDSKTTIGARLSHLLSTHILAQTCLVFEDKLCYKNNHLQRLLHILSTHVLVWACFFI